ncbi:hypothetical protein HUB97_02990 [Halorubraceae archaeon YAN]|nr:hypothetical protein [Halorubraceae archaeon YAN]
MQTLIEKRVFGEQFGTTEVCIATELGLVVVSVSADQVGEFSLSYKGAVSSVAVTAERVAISTPDGVYTASTDGEEYGEFANQFPSESVAVGFGSTGLFTADSDGAVFRINSDGSVTNLGDTAGVRSIDPPLIAAADSVYRISGDELIEAGLSDVNDVSGIGTPFAATTDGLYTLGNGWMETLDGPFSLVASDGHERAHAVGEDGLFVGVNDVWDAEPFPVDEPISAIAHGSGIVAAVTAIGRLCINAGDGWRHQLLGLKRPTSIAVAHGDEISVD